MTLTKPGSSLTLITMVVVTFIAQILCHEIHSHRHETAASRPDLDNPTNKLREADVVRDEDHIQEHLQAETNINVENITDEELEFHYFRLHDTDNNTKLDGLEILAALSHMIPVETLISKKNDEYKGKTEEEVKEMKKESQRKAMEYYIGIIDQVLADDDFNNDGYLTYLEYSLARRRDEAKERQENRRKKRKPKSKQDR